LWSRATSRAVKAFGVADEQDPTHDAAECAVGGSRKPAKIAKVSKIAKGEEMEGREIRRFESLVTAKRKPRCSR
jgi:hypothetical protein